MWKLRSWIDLVVENYSVLYDGWDLAYRPNSHAAMHMMGLLDAQLLGRRSTVTLPAESFHSLPDDVSVVILSAPDSELARLIWEQRRIPMLARQLGTDLVHWFDGGPALFSAARNVISPVGYFPWSLEDEIPGSTRGFVGRMREAMAHGGLIRAHALLWPADLPAPGPGPSVIPLPPATSLERASAAAELNASVISLAGEEILPESFILYHGPTTKRDLFHLLDAWVWASGSIGEYYPLLVAGASASEFPALESWLDAQGFGQTVRLVPPQTLQSLVTLYRECSALFHPAPVPPWSMPLRLGLAFARPIVALETPWSDAIVGPAAYLIAPDGEGRASGRALGAALTTVIVEESLADELSQAARQRAESWDSGAFPQELEGAYLKVIGG